MASESNGLLMSEAALDMNAKSISNWNSCIKSSLSNVTDFSLKLNGLSIDLVDLASSFIDISSQTYDFISDTKKMSSNLSSLSTDFDIMTIDISKLSSDLTGLTSNFNKLSDKMDLPVDSSAFSKADGSLMKISNTAMQMNNELNNTETSTKKSSSGLRNFIKSALSLGNIKSGMKMVDQYVNTGNKLADINDGMQSQANLQNKVSAAATRSYGSYSDMANAVSNIGSLDTFKKDNDSAIGFTEMIQKSLTLDESDQSLSDVTRGLSDGVMQGDEFSSVAGKDTTMGDALSAYTGKSSDQLQEMADQGQITADLLKNAMFAASSDINSEFEKQPMTFANAWTKIQNSAMNALSPLMQLVASILNNPAVQAGLNIVINSLGFISQAASKLIEFVTNNFSKIVPILMAIGIYLAYIGATALISIIQSLAGVIVSQWASIEAEIAAIAPILLIIAIIAAVIYILQSLGVSFEDIFGFIGGVVGVAVAFIWNLFLGLFDFVLGIINYLLNPFINFANFLGNLFTNPVSSIIYLFQGMADNVLGLIQTIASALDKVFGTKMAKTVSGWRSGLKDLADNAVKKYAPDENYKKVIDNLDLSSKDFGFDRMDYSKAYDNGKNVGTGIYDKADKALKSLGSLGKGEDLNKLMSKKDMKDIKEIQNIKDDKLGTSKNPMNIKGTGSGGAVNVSMNNEDLSYLRDMAERDYIAKVATNTLAPNITVSFGEVHETADVNQLFSRIQTILREQIAVAPEGVY